MNGTINVYIPRDSNGELMTSPVPKHRLVYPKHLDARSFFDPDADRNLPNALPTPKAYGQPIKPATVAPRGWRLVSRAALKEVPHDLRPVLHDPARRHAMPKVSSPQGAMPAPAKGAQGGACPTCGRADFRRSGAGLAWHVDRCRKVA